MDTHPAPSCVGPGSQVNGILLLGPNAVGQRCSKCLTQFCPQVQCYLPFIKEELAGILPGKYGSSSYGHPPAHSCSDRDAPQVEGSPGPAPEPASHLQVKHLLWSRESHHMGICAGRFSWAPSTGWEYAGKWLGAPYEPSPWGTARGGAPEVSRAHAPMWEMNRCGCRRPRGSSRHPPDHLTSSPFLPRKTRECCREPRGWSYSFQPFSKRLGKYRRRKTQLEKGGVVQFSAHVGDSGFAASASAQIGL